MNQGAQILRKLKPKITIITKTRYKSEKCTIATEQVFLQYPDDSRYISKQVQSFYNMRKTSQKNKSSEREYHEGLKGLRAHISGGI